MINWAMASDLDRVDHHRASAEWVAGLWYAEDAKLLTLDAESRFSTNAGGSKLRTTKPFMEFDSQRHVLRTAQRLANLCGGGAGRRRDA
jgi:NAD+ diphosphatase